MKRSILLAGFLTTSALAQQGDLLGAWHFRTITDPMSDASRGIAATDAKNEITLVVKCDSNGANELYMSFITNHYLGGSGSDRYRHLSYRIDGSPVQTIAAIYDGKSANIIDVKSDNAGGNLLKAIAGSSKLTVQVADFEGETYTSVIDTTGAKAAIGKTATVCKDTSMGPFLAS